MRFSRLHIKRSSLAGILLPLLVFSACVKETSIEPTPYENKEAMVKFSLMLPGSAATPTRALNEGNENEVRTIEVLVFNPGGGAYRYTAYCSDIDTDGSDMARKTFTVKLVEGTFDLVVLANSRELIPAAYPTGIPVGESQINVFRKLTMAVPSGGKWNAKPADAGYKPIPMWGARNSVNIQEGTSLTGGNAIKLARMVAKVNVTVQDAAKPDFKLTSIRLYNYQTNGSVVPIAGWNATESKATQPNVPTGSARTKGPLLYDGAEITTANVSSLNEIYLFEAAKGGPTSAERANNTCLVVGGRYGAETTETYYRIDFARKVNDVWEYLPILRNHSYNFRITSVGGNGFTDPEDAFNSRPVNMETVVEVWNNFDMGEVVFDGQYMMSVSKKLYNLYRDDYKGINAQTVSIKTDVETGWEAVVALGATSWIKLTGVTPASSSSKVVNATTAVGEKDKVLTLTFEVEENLTGAERTGTISVTAGRLSQVITVTQSTKQASFLNVSPKTLTFNKDGKFINPDGSLSNNGTINLSWSPKEKQCAFTLLNLLNGGIGWTLPAANTGTHQGNVNYTMTVTAPAMADNPSEPFEERISMLTISSTDSEGNPVSETVNMRQAKFGVKIENKLPAYLLDGTTEHSFTVKSNTGWTISKVVDSKGILIPGSYPTSGGYYTTGEAFKFKLVNDLANMAIIAGDVTFTFHSPTNVFADFDVTIMGAIGTLVPKSNSYIVKPDPTGTALGILIPVARANDSSLGQQIGPNTAYTAELVWTDHQGGVKSISGAPNAAIARILAAGKGNDGYVLVMPGNVEGNGVVSCTVPGVGIVWSWHIWVTNYDPDDQAAVVAASSDGRYDTPGGYLYRHTSGGATVFMDRNLGSLYNNASGWSAGTVVVNTLTRYVAKLGLLYQWGRKDGMPGPTRSDALFGYATSYPAVMYNASGTRIDPDVAGTTDERTKTLLGSVRYPATMSAYSQWNYNVSVDAWGNATGVKTVYDPCPVGWKVPTGNVWGAPTTHKDISTKYSQGGYDFNGTYGDMPNVGYYPCTGTIYAGGTPYANATIGGGYWTTNSVSQLKADFLYVYYFTVSNPKGTVVFTNFHASNDKAHGNAVRCVRYTGVEP